MTENGSDFDSVLKDAQAKGYAEADPTADVEGYDACRKIAILTSLAYGKQLDFEDIYTEGITKITDRDIKYAAKLKAKVKIFGSSKLAGDKVSAMVAPKLITHDHPLYSVDGVFNAILVKGNMVGDVMFYGQGAGSLQQQVRLYLILWRHQKILTITSMSSGQMRNLSLCLWMK